MASPFGCGGLDELPNLIGEVDVPIAWPASYRPEDAVADAFGPAWSPHAVPVQVQLTNYRLKLVEPAAHGATLYVTVCGGHDLKPCDSGGKSDPYALLSVTGRYHRSLRHPKRTSVRKNTLDPVWNETFVFENVDAAACLHVSLYDKDRMSQDDFMGEVMVPNVVEATDKNNSGLPRFLTLPVFEGKQRGRGSIRLCVRTEKTQRSLMPPAAKHCSIPLLLIDCVNSSRVDRTIQLGTRTADRVLICFDDPVAAAAAFAAIMSRPRTLDDALCFAACPPGRNPLLPVYQRSGKRSRFHAFSLQGELHRWTTSPRTYWRPASAGDYSMAFRVDHINSEYRLCPTYAEEVIFPALLTREEVESSAAFRSKKRFPCVAWVHPSNGATLVRCSQPQTALGIGKASAAALDRKCLMRFAPAGSSELTICDARPFQNAAANSFAGGGTEYNAAYEGCRCEFLDIENIHEMRKCFDALRAGMGQQGDHDACAAAIAAWLHHVAVLLRGAASVAAAVESGETVVVHCSDGWDRTSQVVSLASLLLDGHYRTIAGLTDLIRKDWLLPGHKFGKRNGLATRQEQREQHDETSPIFPQFLDCVAQLWNVYPRYFEYTPRLLAFILYHSFSGRYVTFLGNCEKERAEMGASSHGVCLWDEILQDPDRWASPCYDIRVSAEPLVPCVVPLRRLAFCEELYSNLGNLWTDSRQTDGGSFLQRVSALGAGGDAEPRRTLSSAISVTSARGRISSGTAEFSYIFCAMYGQDRQPPGPWAMEVELLLRSFTGAPHNFPPRPEVAVPERLIIGDHVEYVIKLTASGSGVSTFVTRRYSKFLQLADSLKAIGTLKIEAPFPPKLLLLSWQCAQCFGVNPAALERRRVHLQTWLRAVVASAASILTADESVCCR